MSASSLASWAAFRVGKLSRWIDFETPDWKISSKRKLYLLRDFIKLMLPPGRRETTLPKKKYLSQLVFQCSFLWAWDTSFPRLSRIPRAGFRVLFNAVSISEFSSGKSQQNAMVELSFVCPRIWEMFSMSTPFLLVYMQTYGGDWSY